MLTRQSVLEMAYWTPLIVLLGSSLGLIALKRMSGLSPWTKRLTAQPFYLVSLPMATLVIGMESVAGAVLWDDVHRDSSAPFFESWLDIISLEVHGLWGFFQSMPISAFVFVILVIACSVMPFVSGYLSWRVLCLEDKRKCPSSRATRRRRALLLLFVFVCAFMSMRFFIFMLVNDPAMSVRIF